VTTREECQEHPPQWMVTIRPEEGDSAPYQDHRDEQGKEDQQKAHDAAFTKPAHGVFPPSLFLRPLLDSSLPMIIPFDQGACPREIELASAVQSPDPHRLTASLSGPASHHP
jgi:hypothetical protein